MTPVEFLLCVFLIAVSAFMSSSEIALFSLSRFQLRAIKERLRIAHRKIKRLLSDPNGLLVTILVVNEIVNISLSTVVAHAVSRGWGNSERLAFLGLPSWALQTLVGTAITAPIILFFGEITPKVIAVKANQLVAPLNVTLLTWIYSALKPVRIAIGYITTTKSTSIEKDAGSLLNEEEFLTLVEEGHKEGAVHESELELIKNVFELDDRTVANIYTPLPQVHSLSATTNVKSALAAMRGKKFSRIPITGANKKEILGIFYSKDLLLANIGVVDLKAPVTALMRKPLVVTSTMRLNTLFRRLKQYKTHMAVVEGLNGESLGIVTMNDVIEALFEDVLEPEMEPRGRITK